MIQATLKGKTVYIAADSDGMATVSRLKGAARTSKMPPMTWWMPMSLDTVEELRREKVAVSVELAQRARAMKQTQGFIERMKTTDHAEPMRPVPIKEGFSLFNHQVKAFNIALALYGYREDGQSADATGGCALYLDMGLGKSLTAIMVAGRMYLDGLIKRVLVIAPSSVCPVWPNEFRKFGAFPSRVAVLQGDRDKRLAALRYVQSAAIPGLQDPLRVAAINYESTWRLADELAAYKPDLIICDESQRIKSHTAQQSKAVHKLGDKARYRMILTGTPVQNDSRDVWSQYRFLDPGIFNSSYYAFEKRYALMGGYGNHQYLGPRNTEELTRKMHSVAFRATKAECLDLPEKMFEFREIQLEPEAAWLYAQIKKASVAELEGGANVTASIVLTRLLRLQQLTGGYLTDDDGETRQVSTAKLDALEDIMQSLCVDEGKKLVVFTKFKAEMEGVVGLAQRVLGKSLRYVRIDGSTAMKDRGDIVKQFQEDEATRLFIGNLSACAEGLTLTAADTVVYYSLTFNSAQYRQSQDRIHRIGQENRCVYIILSVPKTIDDKIASALDRKIDLANKLTDNWRWLLAEEGE